MNGYVAVVRYIITLIFYAGYIIFVFRVNEKMKQCIGSLERVTIISLSIVGVYILINKITEYFSAKVP